MIESIKNVAILGPGLLGGSIGLACRELGMEVAFWGRSEARVDEVREAGFSATTELAEAIRGAQLIILAVPVPYMGAMAEQLIVAGVGKDQLVTDVGSVKQAVLDAVCPVLSKHGISFIGSHPMAGSEQQGFSAADAKILDGAMCIITQEADPENPEVYSVPYVALHDFWLALGMKVSPMPADLHDMVVAKVSHVPHILAAVCAHVALPLGSHYGQFSGGGLRDTSRVASGDPALWTGIVLENAGEITATLQEAIGRLSEYKAVISSGDEDAVQRLLTEDKERRDSYFSPPADT